jgi:Flp pilus assembly protein TadG
MRKLRSLLARTDGASAVEFGLIAPVFLLLLLGVFQVGAWLQAYNAMRNAVTKTARSVSVEYQTDNKLTNQQIADMGLAIGSTAPYMLKEDDLQVEVTVPATQSFTTARELNLKMTYQMPSFLDFAGISGPSVTYSRALFVITS